MACEAIFATAWSPSDMPGIPREVAEHSLDIRPNSKLVKQRLRRFDKLKRRAISEDYTSLKKHVPRFPFFCRVLIKSLIQLRDANFYPFLMLIPAITKSR